MYGRNEISGDQRPTRKHFHYRDLEEYWPHGGMWQIPSTKDRVQFVAATSTLMADVDRFAAAMRRALTEWPKSTAQALTTEGMNQRAWLGHAGCFIATGSPEETTRLGWHELDDAEQYGANAAADRVIAAWQAAHRPHEVAGQLSFLDGI